jgi:transposase
VALVRGKAAESLPDGFPQFRHGAVSCDPLQRFQIGGAEQARTNEDARRLTPLPGIGALHATALVAAIGDVSTFARGRDLAAWLSLVPHQVMTGEKHGLVGITKRNSRSLCRTSIQGADAAMPAHRQGDTMLVRWLRGLMRTQLWWR